MSRFQLYAGEGAAGYVIDLQSDFLNRYNTRIVAPVISEADYDGTAAGLNPVIDVGGQPHVVMTHLLAAVPAGALRKTVADYSSEGDRFTRALDLLFQGY